MSDGVMDKNPLRLPGHLHAVLAPLSPARADGRPRLTKLAAPKMNSLAEHHDAT